VVGVGGQGEIAGFRPEHVAVGNGPGDAMSFHARVEVVEAKLGVEEQLERGRELEFSVPRDKLLLFDAATGERVRRA
jgi:hypothetical protein